MNRLEIGFVNQVSGTRQAIERIFVRGSRLFTSGHAPAACRVDGDRASTDNGGRLAARVGRSKLARSVLRGGFRVGDEYVAFSASSSRIGRVPVALSGQIHAGRGVEYGPDHRPRATGGSRLRPLGQLRRK